MASDDTSPADRRAGHRQRVLLGGKLVYGQSNFSVDCTIRDLTDAGARVRLPANQFIEANVWLINLKAGLAYEGLVAWRTASELGLRFVSQIDLRQATEGPHRLLRRLWIDCGGQ